MANNVAVAKGQSVEINPRDDRTRKLRISGVVSEVLTKNQNHPHGVLVRLETGEIGRVQNTGDTPKTGTKLVSDKLSSSVSDLIEAGENHNVEFKTDALWSTEYTAEDIKNHRPQTKELHLFGKVTSKIIIAKTLAAFLNSDGGDLLIGYKEGKAGNVNEVVGIEAELDKLKESSLDGYRLMLVELIKEYFPATIFNQFNSYFRITYEEVDAKTICRISTSKSKVRVFLKLQKKDYFFVRIDASTRELTGEEIVDYCDSRFSRK